MIRRYNPLTNQALRGKRITNPLVASVIHLLVIAVCTGIAILITNGLIFTGGVLQDDPTILGASRMVLNLALGFGLSVTLLGLWLHFYESRSIASLGFVVQQHNVLKSILRGLAVGLIIVTATFAIMSFFGDFTVELTRGSVATVVGGLVPVVVIAVGWTIQASTEEALRSWLIQNGSLRYGIAVGVGLSTLVFVITHLMGGANTPLSIGNLFLGGIMFALYALREGSLWGVCALHTVMNWSEQHIFGYSVSGPIPGGSILETQAGAADLITGGATRTGAAGGLAYSVVVMAAIIVLLVSLRRNYNESMEPNSASEFYSGT